MSIIKYSEIISRILNRGRLFVNIKISIVNKGEVTSYLRIWLELLVVTKKFGVKSVIKKDGADNR